MGFSREFSAFAVFLVAMTAGANPLDSIPEAVCPAQEEPAPPPLPGEPTVQLPDVGPIPLPRPRPTPPKVPEIPDDGPDLSSTGIELYDRALRDEEPKSILPFWFGYPWAKIKTPVLWTRYLSESLRTNGRELLRTAPKDAELFCPNFKNLNDEQRLAFWVRLISLLMERESTYNPVRTYSGESIEYGLFSTGLLMLSLSSAKQSRFGCTMIQSNDDLFFWRKNMDCAVRIMSFFYKEDQVIASHSQVEPGTGRWMGLSRYWEPMRDNRLRGEKSRHLLMRSVKQQRLDWLEEGRGKSHPAKRDEIHKSRGEKSFGRILRLMNQMAFCPSGSPDDYEAPEPLPEIVPIPRPRPEPWPPKPEEPKIPPGCPPIKK
ncbi:MAG: hypothetical protein KF789_00570 [Bdellovibrionaceae bacterium]|nr:hypothetical protein [Pseudobdellovibrionaceae bacterium]